MQQRLAENRTGIDTSRVDGKSASVSLKTKVDKLSIDKLVPVTVDLSKLSNVVKNYIVKKKTVYDYYLVVN